MCTCMQQTLNMQFEMCIYNSCCTHTQTHTLSLTIHTFFFFLLKRPDMHKKHTQKDMHQALNVSEKKTKVFKEKVSNTVSV